MSNKNWQRSFLVVLGMIFLGTSAESQVVENDGSLPGHLQSEYSALQASSDVVVATLIGRGVRDAGSAGIMEYSKVDVQVDRSLKGKAEGKIQCSYDRREGPKGTAEAEPRLGTQYVLFMNHLEKRGFAIVRFSPFSEKRVAEIQKVVDVANAAAIK